MRLWNLWRYLWRIAVSSPYYNNLAKAESKEVTDYPIVHITWLDACDEISAVVSFIPKMRPYTTNSVGFLVYEDDECISLAAEIETVDPNEDRNIEPRAKHIVTVPQVLITERHVLVPKDI